MAVINLKKLTQEWFEKTHRGRNRGIDENDITVRGRIKVLRNSVHWTKTSQNTDEKSFKRQINIVNHKPQALAQISVPASDNVTRVFLEEGIVKGFQGKKKTSLPLGTTGLNFVFGESFEIDPCLPAQEHRESMDRCSNRPVLSEKHIGKGSTSAVIHYKQMEAEWKFVCDGILTANAIIGYGGHEINFVEIIRELKELSDNDDLDDIEVVNDKQLQFTISGYVVFKWDCQHEVVWC